MDSVCNKKNQFNAALKVILSVFFAVAIFSAPAYAEFVKFDKERLFAYPTSSEDVVLDFIKLSGVKTPEFEKMVIRTEKYKKISETERMSYLQDELFRLNKRYLTIDPVKEGILVRVAVKVYFENMTDRQPFLSIEFPSKGLVYFPYYYGGLPIAVIINGIEDFQKIYLTEEERQQVAAIIDPTPETTLVLDLIPVDASAKKPLLLDGEQQFPLLCNISYIGIHNKQSDQVWAWASDANKKTEKSSSLMDLSVKSQGMEDSPPPSQ